MCEVCWWRSQARQTLDLAHQPWKGDLDGMVDRGFIRVLTVRNPIFFSYNGIDQRGLLLDAMRIYGTALRKKLGKKAKDLHVMPIVVPRDMSSQRDA